MRDRTTEQAGEGSGPLKIMYPVNGSSDQTEKTLEPLRGLAAPGRCASATARPTSSSSTSTARPWTVLHADNSGLTMAHQGWLAVAEITD